MTTILLAAILGHGEPSDPPRFQPDPPRLVQRVAELEARVDQLERRLGMAVAPRVGPATSAVVVPPGQHAHRTTSGEVIVHGNENLGNAAAHAGISYPWIRIAEGGQTLQTTTCPAGGCPQQQPLFQPFGGAFRRR